jgi:DNA-binding transcriptional LysR family regulator
MSLVRWARGPPSHRVATTRCGRLKSGRDLTIATLAATVNYALTAGGEELLAAARRMAEAVTELERKLSGQDLRLEGALRVTTTDTLMASLLPRVLARFRALHPGILLEAATANAFANLTRRDADVAIRPTASPPETLVGRRVSGVAFAVDAAEDSRLARPAPGDPEFGRHPWIGLDDSLAGPTVARWMRAVLPDAPIGLRCDSLVAAAAAARAGLGLAALPCYLGAPGSGAWAPALGEPVSGMATALWV